MNKYIESIRERLDFHKNEVIRFEAHLKEIVKNCKHDFSDHPSESNSHYDYYRCLFCGELFKETDKEVSNYERNQRV